MKLAVIAQGSIPAQTANSIQNMKMAHALASLGHELCIFVPGRNPNLPWEEIAKHYGLDRRLELEWLPSRTYMRRYDFALAAVAAAGDWNADLIYTRLPQAAALAAARGLPVIFELHDLPTGVMGPWLLRRFLAGKRPRRVVVNTRRLADLLGRRYRITEGLLLLAPNGVDLARYDNLPGPSEARRLLGFPEKFTAGYTGHLYNGRGIELIVEMARRLPDVFFLFVGGREEDVQRMTDQARGLGNVRFIGFVPNADLPSYQAACDVFLMPYSRRVASSSGVDIAAFTNPLKMFEYLATGRPIVASDLPILGEVLNENNAIILPADDIDIWVENLRSLQGSPEKRAALSEAAKDTAAEYSWEKRAASILHDLS